MYFPLFLSVLALASAQDVPCKELSDGNKIPIVALGTGRGTAKANDTVEHIRETVVWAIEAGYRHIDTAAIYGDEKQVGEGIADAIAKGLVKREDLFVTTKLWSDKHAENQVVPALQNSLRELGLKYVDLYLVHFPVAINEDGSPANIDYLETWKGMEAAKKLGLTKSIGVSNFNKAQLDRLMANSKVKPVVNEIEVNPTNTQEELVAHCQKLGVVVMAYSPLGYLVARKQVTAPAPHYGDAHIGNFATKYKKSPAQIVLRYLLDRGVIPIPKSTNKERIASNIDLFDFELSKDEVATINSFNQNKQVLDFTQWQSYPHYPF